MVSPHPAELALIGRDVADCKRLIRAMITHPDGALYVFSVTGVVGLVIEESRRLLFPAEPDSEAIIASPAKARARLKLFDDRDGYAAGLIDILAEAQSKSEQAFAGRHRGLLAPLKRAMQPDLGAYWVGQNLLATTHTALPSLGIARSELDSLTPAMLFSIGPRLMEFSRKGSVALARTASALMALGEDVGQYSARPNDEVAITNNDFKGRKFYPQATLRLGCPDGKRTGAAIYAIGQVNAALHLLPHLLGTESNLVLRFQVL